MLLFLPLTRFGKTGLLLSLAIAVAAVVIYIGIHRFFGPQSSSPTGLAASPAAVASPAPSALAAPPEVANPQSVAAPTTVPPAAAVNIAAPEYGGHIASASSEADREDRAAIHVIDRGLPEESSWTAAGPSPQEVVIGFFQGHPARVTSVLIDPNTRTAARWAKDVEVWASMESATAGFTKVASLTLKREDGEQVLELAPVEARYLKLRIISQYLGDDLAVGLGKVKVLGVLDEGDLALANRASPAPPVAAQADDLAGDVCAAAPAVAAPPPAHEGSRKVLVLSRKDAMYPPLRYSAKDMGEDEAASILSHLAFTRVAPGAASAALLDPSAGFDTVVLSQVCDIKTSFPDSFTRALLAWVGAGHKLIVHDADVCDTGHLPDYGFLPYRFATSNPGKRGAESRKLTFVEENSLGRSTPGDPAFLDLDAWARDHNELGDSNTVTAYDAHWCGALMTRNILNINGFVETYAHYGRGLIIYDGFDYDQAANPHYRQLVTRELAQPFAPDGLQCSARLADFVLTTESALRTRFMAAGQTYHYPVTLLSNQGYKGTVQLTAGAIPADPSVSVTLDKDAVDLSDTSDVQLTVTTSGNAGLASRTIAVRGADAGGHSSVLCLWLGERTTGGLRVVSDFPKPAHPTKNLEIILDLSGSMKLPLGTSTRIATARRVLRDVVARLPSDFNVGLRVYGHRYGSRQKETCTDSELVVPIKPLDRSQLLSVIDSKQPRGETPLVYSVLQTADDLKATGGGSVILITDGEESCHGDPVAAARQIQASGVDISLQILGFTLTGKQVQQDLSQFAAAAGGRYYAAEDGEGLARALLMAAVDKIAFAVLDANGRQVAQGVSDANAIELPPGDYTVVVHASTGELRADHVAVVARGDSVVTVAIDGTGFRLRH